MNILELFKRPKQPCRTVSGQSDRFEITLSGSGGQGIVLAGKILAEAAAIYDKKEAVMTKSYGPEARGGASKTEIVISPGKIDYPKVIHMDVLLAMTQEAMDRYGGELDAGGLLIIDDVYVKKVPAGLKNIFQAPFSRMTLKTLNAQLVANIMALGALAAITRVVSREALTRAVITKAPDKVLVLDRVAVDMGFKVVEESGFKWKKKV